MSDRAATSIAWATARLALACALAGLALRLALLGEPMADSRGVSSILLPVLGALPFVLVGGVVSARRLRRGHR